MAQISKASAEAIAATMAHHYATECRCGRALRVDTNRPWSALELSNHARKKGWQTDPADPSRAACPICIQERKSDAQR